MAATTRPFLHAHHAHAHAAHRKKRSTARNAGDEAIDEHPFISSSRDASEEDNDDADVDADAPSDGPSSPMTSIDKNAHRPRRAPLGVIGEAAAPVETEPSERSLLSVAATAAAAASATPSYAPTPASSAAAGPGHGPGPGPGPGPASGPSLASGPAAAIAPAAAPAAAADALPDASAPKPSSVSRPVVSPSATAPVNFEHAPPAVTVAPDATPGLVTPRGELSGDPRPESTPHLASALAAEEGREARSPRPTPQSDADASLASDEAPIQGGGYTSASLSSRDPVPTLRYGHAHLDPHVPDNTTPYDGDVEFAARPAQHPNPASSTAPAAPASASPAASHFPLPATGGTAPNPVPNSSWGEHPERLESEQAGELLMPASSDEIRTWFHDAIYRPVEGQRAYSISRPPGDGRDPSRPVRIYADGVYDLFHYAHALQLRQAKLAFPCVHLIVGVCSSAACKAHKNEPVMSSAERYAAVSNCRWVDEVLEDAPWVVDQKLLDALQIDYVAHDEEPYAGPAGAADVYRFVKDQGRFLPTRRTPGVSTSELLARIVDVYKSHALDSKLKKVADARSAAASLTASRSQSAAQSRRPSQDEGRRA